MLGGRPLSRIVKEVFAPRNYLALGRMTRVCVEPRDVARRYFLGGGDYPHRPGLRTPLGVIRPELYSHHDVWTVVEIFCREDYRADDSTGVVVDIGSNIGISALYFLTRNADSRCYLYEPDPRNLERLERNLDPFKGRWQVEEAAVGPEDGTVAFGREPTGRYGGVGAETGDQLQVRCLAVNDVLEDVLDREPAVDIVKIDTEGLEEATVAAIRPELLDRIGTIYFETPTPARLHGERFDYAFANETVRLRNRGRSDALTER